MADNKIVVDLAVALGQLRDNPELGRAISDAIGVPAIVQQISDAREVTIDGVVVKRNGVVVDNDNQPTITGMLRNATYAGNMLFGSIYGDTRGRFYDGEAIRTSKVMEVLPGDVFVTRNSVYKVDSWFGGKRPAEIPAAREPSAANDNIPDHAANVNALVKMLHGKSTDNKWWIDPASGQDLSTFHWFPYVVGTKLMLMVSEIAEGMEGHRKGLMDDKLKHRPMIEVELADAVIRIFDLAGKLGLDLGGAIIEKTSFNDVRPDHKMEARLAAGGKAY